ncbi:MAG TPA: ABC transporter permease subunit [Bacteroidetes bacterium]|nr:ABC transporter permease subunit [Bacteroidota bacterium]
MTSYFIRRLIMIIPTFIGITLMVFFILQLTPGGPLEQEIMKLKSGMAQMGGGGITGSGAGVVETAGGGGKYGSVEIPEEALEEMKRYYNLDKPIPVRYAIWLWNIIHLDFGNSYTYAEPVWDVIKSRFPISIYFGLISFILVYVVCIPLGVAKAVKHGSPFDLASSVLVFIGYSIPGWALGAVLLVLLGGGSFWDVFPLGEFRSEFWEDLSFWGKITDQVYHTILPVIAYMVGGFASMTVLMKNSLMENLGQDYVRTAFAKGLAEKRVVFVHALRNSLIPIVTGIGGLLGIFFMGSYLIEKTFNINGMGLLTFNALLVRDYPIMLTFLVIGSLIKLTGAIISDVIYAVVDPRIRFK